MSLASFEPDAERKLWCSNAINSFMTIRASAARWRGRLRSKVNRIIIIRFFLWFVSLEFCLINWIISMDVWMYECSFPVFKCDITHLQSICLSVNLCQFRFHKNDVWFIHSNSMYIIYNIICAKWIGIHFAWNQKFTMIHCAINEQQNGTDAQTKWDFHRKHTSTATVNLSNLRSNY